MSYQHIQREYWKKRIIDAWRRRSVIWLSGVRRAGKTILCQSLSNVEYFDWLEKQFLNVGILEVLIFLVKILQKGYFQAKGLGLASPGHRPG